MKSSFLAVISILPVALPRRAVAAPSAPIAIVFDDAFTLPEVAFGDARAQSVKLITALPAERPVALYASGVATRRLAEYGLPAPDLAAAAAGLERAGAENGPMSALQQAWGEGVARHPGLGGDLVLVSDGRTGLSAAQFPQLVEQFVKSGWRIHALGVGTPDGALLRQLSGMTGGDYHDATQTGLAALTAALAGAPPAPAVRGAAPAPPVSAPAPAPVPGIAPRTLGLVVAMLALAGLLGTLFLRNNGNGAREVAKPRAAADGGMAISDEFRVRPGDPPGILDLVCKAGPKRGMTITIDARKGLTMGRSRSCDLVISDSMLSGQHLKITVKEGRYMVDDLRSTNGTFLNSSRILSAELRPGDLLKLGASEFLVKSAGGAAGDGKAA